MDRNARLTPNFTLAEFLSPNAPVPKPAILHNIKLLANRLQAVRDVLNKPIIITSGYRTPGHNAKVGGAPSSYHVNGMAADFLVTGMAPKAVQDFLKHWSGGLGLYTTHTHVDIGPKRRW